MMYLMPLKDIAKQMSAVYFSVGEARKARGREQYIKYVNDRAP